MEHSRTLPIRTDSVQEFSDSPTLQSFPNADQASPAEHVPQSLGPYRIVRRVGAGGMGVVYEAVDDERGSRVALKTLPSADPSTLFSFKNEYRSVANVTHPNLATLYELMAIDDTWFFTMEFVNGVDILRYVWGDRPPSGAAGLPPAVESRLRSALKQLAMGVQALHAAELLHLDLKPANVLVEESGRVVVLDFGLVQSFRKEPGPGEERPPLAGTPLYISPEQVLDNRASEASDWYAVGVMLFQALTGATPFDANGALWDVLLARTRAPAPHPSSLRAGLPDDLTDLCCRLLLQDPAARPDGDEVLRLLNAAPKTPLLPPQHLSIRALIGRQTELDALIEAWNESQQRPLSLFVKGLSGMGKTALLYHFLSTLQEREEVFVLSGRCFERESVPYKGFDAIIDALCRALPSLAHATARAILGEDAHYVAQIFPTLAGLEIMKTISDPPKGRLDPQERRRLAFVGLRRIFQRLCKHKRVVMFIDDLHWGDVDSARLYFELLSPPDPPPLFLLASYRSDEADQSPFFRELASLQSHSIIYSQQKEIEIGPLNADDALWLALIHMGTAADIERARAVAHETGGIPFFIKELARHAALPVEEEPSSQPLSLNRVIESRLDTMPEDARRVLHVVSVAGHPIEQSVALQAAQVAEGSQTALSFLRSAHFLRTRGMRGTDLVETYHDRIRESVTSSLSTDALSSIHNHLALALEAGQRAKPDALAYHFHGAGDLPRASKYAEQAADQAASALAFDRAAQLYANALKWSGDTPERDRGLIIRRARALSNAGRCAEAAPLYLNVSERGEPHERRELRRLAADAYLAAGHLQAGLGVAKPLLAEVNLAYPSSATRALLSSAKELLLLRLRGIDFTPRPETQSRARDLFPVDLCWSLGKGLSHVLPVEGIYFMIESLRCALAAGEPTRIGRGLAYVGSQIHLFSRKGGEMYLSRADELARELSDPYLQGMTLILRGLVNIAEIGKWKILLEQVDRGVELLRAHCTGVSWEATLGTGISMKALEIIGDIGAFGRRAADWSREATERGDKFTQVMADQCVVLSRIASGDIAGARRQDARVLASWDRSDYTVQHFYSMILRTYCDLYEGRGAEAWERFQAQWQDIKRAQLLKVSISRIPILYAKACLQIERASAAARGKVRDDLLTATEQIAGQLHKESRTDGPPHALLIRAAVASQRRESAKAMELLEAARAAYDRTDIALSAACALRRKAEILRNTNMMEEADEQIRALGVASPERWVECYTPRFAV